MKINKNFARIGLAIFLAMSLVVLALMTIRASAAPLPIPTPVSSPANRAASSSSLLTFMNDEAVTADGRGTTLNLSNYSIVDLQYVIDQGTTPNTVTLTIQYSCDGVNWVNGADLVASNAADATNIVQLNNYCRYTNVYANVTNTETVTVSVYGVGK